MKQKFIIVFLMIVLLGSWQAVIAGEQLLRYPSGSSKDDFRYNYPVRVLQLALDKTATEYGAARVIQVNTKMTNARTIVELENGTLLDVITHPARRDLDKRFLSVPICIRKGILGIRLFLIDKNRQSEFSAIRKLDELKKLSAGQGYDWLDTSILKSNGFKVTTGASYDGLFQMLMARRFDYFPRGLHEPFTEVQQRSSSLPNLTVEKTLALYYPFPDFFWLNKKNTLLAERILKGMKLAIADGSFDKLFESEFGDFIRQARLDKRLIFRIPNTEYQEYPYAGDPKYWLIESIKHE